MNSRPIKIAIDAVGIDEPGGGRTATLYLLDNLFDIHPNWQYVIYVSQKEPSFYRYPNVQQIQLPVTKGIFARAVVQLVFFYISLKKKADLVHFMKSQGAMLFGGKIY